MVRRLLRFAGEVGEGQGFENSLGVWVRVMACPQVHIGSSTGQGFGREFSRNGQPPNRLSRYYLRTVARTGCRLLEDRE